MSITAFPLVVPTSKDYRNYSGYLKLLNDVFSVTITNFGKNGSVLVDGKLKQFVEDNVDVVQKLFQSSSSVDEFLSRFSDFCLKYLATFKVETHVEFAPSYYETIVALLNRIGWDNVDKLNDSLSDITLYVIDKCNRRHLLHVNMINFPGQPIYLHSLPVTIEQENTNIETYYLKFRSLVDSLQDFFAVYDDFSANCWLLNTDSNYVSTLRINLGNSKYLTVDIDPFLPFKLPKLRMMGELKQNDYIWNESSFPRINLSALFSVSFPKQVKSDAVSDDSCAICYSLLLNSEIPSIKCTFASCSKVFHTSCLSSWLHSVPTSKYVSSFATIFGSCPYCATPIRCAE